MLVLASYRLVSFLQEKPRTYDTVQETGLVEGLTPEAVESLRELIASWYETENGRPEVVLIALTRLDYPETDQ